MDEDDPYWLQRCNGCGTGHSNLECVTQAAANVGMPLEEAMRVFRPPTRHETIPDKWVNWANKHKVDSDG